MIAQHSALHSCLQQTRQDSQSVSQSRTQSIDYHAATLTFLAEHVLKQFSQGGTTSPKLLQADDVCIAVQQLLTDLAIATEEALLRLRLEALLCWRRWIRRQPLVTGSEDVVGQDLEICLAYRGHRRGRRLLLLQIVAEGPGAGE